MADSPTYVDHLEPGMTGRWLLTSQGSKHLLDLDTLTWTRYRDDGRGAFVLDATPVQLTSIAIWPKVGLSPLFVFPHPQMPGFQAEYYLSALRSIESVAAPDDAADLA